MNRKGTNGVVEGSVWESRMKVDEFKGGIMVFKSEETLEDSNNSPAEEIIITNDSGISSASSINTREQQIMDKRVNFKPKQSPPTLSGKRRTWKSDSVDGNQIQIARQRSEMSKNIDEQCREMSTSLDGIKKSPIQMKKARSESNKEMISSVDSMDKTPLQKMKTRSVSQKGLIESNNAIEKRPFQLRKIKSEAKTESSDGKLRNNLQLVRAKSVSNNDLDEKCKSPMVANDQTVRKTNVGEGKDQEKPIKRTESDENFKDFGVCEEKLITSTSINPLMIDDQEQSLDDDDDKDDWDKVAEDEVDEEIKDEIEKKSIVVKNISISSKKPQMSVIEVKKTQQSNERALSVSSVIVKKPPPANLRNVSVHSTPTRTKSIPTTEEFQTVSKSHNKLESLVDLVMWRDVSKSAFIFGVGAFVIISSSYTQELKISLISVVSYISLVYLAAIFLFRSFINRGGRDVIYSSSKGHVVGEEEAVWLIKLIIPYVNEFLLNIRALFSGDPSTTMKMAVVLFVLARCGSSITIWKMAKLGFFGVFIVPKICSSYSSQMTGYGKFWIRRFKDAWESCSHKKAVAFGVFTLVWNLSSIVARFWAVFMLFVAFKYYQQGMMGEECRGEEPTSTDQENCWEGQLERQRKERRTMIMETRKQKKAF